MRGSGRTASRETRLCARPGGRPSCSPAPARPCYHGAVTTCLLPAREPAAVSHGLSSPGTPVGGVLNKGSLTWYGRCFILGSHRTRHMKSGHLTSSLAKSQVHPLLAAGKMLPGRCPRAAQSPVCTGTRTSDPRTSWSSHTAVPSVVGVSPTLQRTNQAQGLGVHLQWIYGRACPPAMWLQAQS